MTDHDNVENLIREQALMPATPDRDVTIRILARLLDKRDREVYLWRGMLVATLFLIAVLTIITFAIDRRQHAADNIERAKHWQKIEDGMETNRQSLIRFDDHLRACTNCHSHNEHDKLLKVWEH